MIDLDAMRKLINRPYSGQIHTHTGQRGKTAVECLTLRDIADCYALAVFDSAYSVCPEGYEDARGWKLDRSKLYGWDLNQLDPIAIEQNLCCRIEMIMGIYPNVPSLEQTDAPSNLAKTMTEDELA